jgi:beta-RFAP synthase
MFSFGRAEVRQFGGVGLMVNRPGLSLSLTTAAEVSAEGPDADRAKEVARRVLAILKDSSVTTSKTTGDSALGDKAIAGCTIKISSAPRGHVGLGSGTQLALAITAGLHLLHDLPMPRLIELAQLAGRAHRSAIGTYGFGQGGLLIESGKRTGQQVSPLVARTDIPEAWRFVLVCPRLATGLWGDAERKAFASLPPVPITTTAELCRRAILELLPAAQQGDYETFSTAMYEYGRLAGECFASAQGGGFAGPVALEVIERVRRWGFHGAAQSSWGPTVAVLTPDETQARRLTELLEHEKSAVDLSLVIAEPENSGADWKVFDINDTEITAS